MSNSLNSLAFVLPRYGKSLGGGAEALMRSLILALRKMDPAQAFVKEIEVWTTCAVDHRTWSNFLPEGVSEEDGILIRRFPVDARNTDVFVPHELAIASGAKLSVEAQFEWLSHSVNSVKLYQHIVEHGKEFDAILFAPYLFGTSFWGALIYPERSIVFPCLHNEPYAYLEVFYYWFSKVRGVIFNALPECQLANTIYKLPDFSSRIAVVGMGFNKTELRLEVDSLGRFNLKHPYILYAGRKESGKNLNLLFSYYTQLREQFPTLELELLVIGAGDIPFCSELPLGVRDLGFVTEAEKESLMRQALFLCQPSVNESFSIVMMEAWLAGTPVVVHGDCAVTRFHVEKSGGGLYFSNSWEFAMVVHEFINKPSQRNVFGKAGKDFVEHEYSWDAVLRRLREALVKFKLLQVDSDDFIPITHSKLDHDSQDGKTC